MEEQWPSQSEGTIRCVVLSDTHGQHGFLSPLPYGDVLFHLGDVADKGNLTHIRSFTEWLSEQPHPHKILIGGNHDRDLRYPDKISLETEYRNHATLLRDEIVEIEGLRILGVAWETIEQQTEIPKHPLLQATTEDKHRPIHLLLTHMCSQGMRELREELEIKVHLFGHFHKRRGVASLSKHCVELNCSTIPSMKPVVLDFEKGTGDLVMVHIPDPWSIEITEETTLRKGEHFG